jgi:hypothetical protein
MNMFGFILFNRDVIAAEIARRSGHSVKLGRLNWQADSYHIYGKDIADAKARLFDRLATTAFEDRVYEFSDEMIQEIYHEAEAAVRLKIEAVKLDSTTVKVHPDGTGASKKTDRRPSENPAADGPPRFIWLPRMLERP